MLGCPWLTIAGLVSDMIGAAIVAGAAIPWTYEQRMTRSFGRIAGDTPASNRKLASYRETVRGSWLTAFGVALIFLGFVLQILGNWP